MSKTPKLSDRFVYPTITQDENGHFNTIIGQHNWVATMNAIAQGLAANPNVITAEGLRSTKVGDKEIDTFSELACLMTNALYESADEHFPTGRK